MSPGAVGSAPAVDPPIGTGAGQREVKSRSGVRVPPSARFDTEGGLMQYYPTDRRFTATCDNPLHGSCVLTRYDRQRSRMQGRPCGLMMAWLAASAVVETKEDHFNMVAELEADYEIRQDYRKSIAVRPGGPGFLTLERGSAEGIEIEPARP